MDRPLAPAAYIAEDGLVGHQWEENPLVLPRLNPQCRGMPGKREKGCVVGCGNTLIEEEVGGWVREVMNRKQGKGITFEM